jgi:hypothetical protein
MKGFKLTTPHAVIPTKVEYPAYCGEGTLNAKVYILTKRLCTSKGNRE